MAKIERYTKAELVEYCKNIGLETKGKIMKKLLQEALEYGNEEIRQAINKGRSLEFLTSKIEKVAEGYANTLESKIENRKKEMKEDDNSHYLIYRVLGITHQHGKLIDEYQNEGRFLYNHAGLFLEEATVLCLKFKNVDGGRKVIENNQGKIPKTFEIDFLDGNNAIEIKWKDATTDGNHKEKEHTRVKAIASQNYVPIRVMFYYPHRSQAINIQENLAIFYKGVKGQYYGGDEAWDFIKEYTGFDLKEILINIADKRTPKHESK
ncbi:MAG: hypothetical protein ACI81T_002557 [Bacteroidia bacterium]|jgi:hypothetical protein